MKKERIWTLKRLKKMFFTDPNSPEGYQIRRDILDIMVKNGLIELFENELELTNMELIIEESEEKARKEILPKCVKA